MTLRASNRLVMHVFSMASLQCGLCGFLITCVLLFFLFGLSPCFIAVVSTPACTQTLSHGGIDVLVWRDLCTVRPSIHH